MLTSRRGLILGLCGLWTLCGVTATLAFLGSLRSGAVRMNETPSPARLISMQMAPWIVVALLTPVVIVLADRWAVERGRVAGWAGIHSLLLTAFVFIHNDLTIAAQYLMRGEWPRLAILSSIPGRAFSSIALLIIEYALIVGAVEAARLARAAAAGRAEARRLAERTLALERDLASTRLMMLRQQLQPHFLFNALNTITSLIGENPAAAGTLVARLGDLLRMSLDRGMESEVTLGEELDVVDRYLAVEEARFGDRLAVEFDIDEHVVGLAVPSFLLQPLVENSVRHGVAQLPAGGTVAISVKRRGARLSIRVANDAAPAEGSPVERLGLSHTRARLSGLYGADAQLSVARTDRTFTVDLELPARAVSRQ